jgi:formylmethanofuran dehydrogenase subunit B
MCDDIVLHVEGNRIVQADRACPIGERWFTESSLTDNAPSCLIDGEAAELAVGYDRAAEILAGAQSPLVFGLAGATCEAVRVAVVLADRLGACIDPADDATAALTTAVQSAGLVTATLGEVRHRADLVIFWHVDPATTHPRHFERYSLTCVGRWIPHGRAERTCVVVDHEPTATAAQADLFLQIQPGRDADALAVLQTLAVGAELDTAGADSDRSKMDRLCGRTGVALSRWQELTDRMNTARYGALFFDPGRNTPDRAAALESLLRLVHDMNEHTHFVALPIGQASNATGAEQVLTWQTGYPHSVSFAEGYPQFDPDRYSAEAMLRAGRADATLVVDAVATPRLSDAAREHLATIPTIMLSTSKEDVASTAAVVFRVAVPGIHAGGTVFRSDGVPLPLRLALASPRPTAETVLTEVNQRICVPGPHG